MLISPPGAIAGVKLAAFTTAFAASISDCGASDSTVPECTARYAAGALPERSAVPPPLPKSVREARNGWPVPTLIWYTCCAPSHAAKRETSGAAPGDVDRELRALRERL